MSEGAGFDSWVNLTLAFLADYLYSPWALGFYSYKNKSLNKSVLFQSAFLFPILKNVQNESYRDVYSRACSVLVGADLEFSHRAI